MTTATVDAPRSRPTIKITLPFKRRRASATIGEPVTVRPRPIKALKRTAARFSLGFQRWVAKRSTFTKFFTFFATVFTAIYACFFISYVASYMTIGMALMWLGYETAAWVASEIVAVILGCTLSFMALEYLDKYFTF